SPYPLPAWTKYAVFPLPCEFALAYSPVPRQPHSDLHQIPGHDPLLSTAACSLQARVPVLCSAIRYASPHCSMLPEPHGTNTAPVPPKGLQESFLPPGSLPRHVGGTPARTIPSTRPLAQGVSISKSVIGEIARECPLQVG